MEAAAAASADEAPLIAPANGTVKKKFRARKTMTASCRQQLASLKIKNSLKNENTGKESPNRSAQQPELICETNFTAQDNPAAKINKSQGVFPNGLKVSIEVSQLDSEINIGCSYNETWDGISKKSEDVPFSHTAHFVVRDFNAVASENHIAGLEPDTSPTNTGSQVLSEDALQIAESTPEVEARCELANVECSAISENLNASITLKIIEDESFKKTSSTDVVAPPEPTDTDGASAPRNQLDPSHCSTDGSNALTSPPTVTADSDSVQPECDAAGGVCKKKRTCSESSDVPEAKRAKTSNNILLDEIQCLIDRRINILFEGLFDERMQTLTRQADLVRRNGNHTDDVARHLQIIQRLERRLKYAVHLQGQLGTCSSTLTPAHSSSEELHNTDAQPDTSPVVPPAEATESRPITPSAPNPSSSVMDLVVLSDNECEQPSHPEQCQAERPNSTSTKMDSAAMQKIMESIKQHRKKAHSSRTDKTVIDLTDDEEQRCDKEANVDKKRTLPGEIFSSQGQSEEQNVRDQQVVTDHSASAPLSEGNVGVENVFDKCTVENDLALRNHNEASSSYDVNEEKTATPKSPPSENLQESVVKQKTDPAKPPQKPQLRLAQVQNPKGIALSWNVATVDPRCAPAKSYCLYVHQGDPNNPKKLWKKIGEIKALPLPMACTLTQFVEDTTYSFAMRAKDAGGRFGPLCDIQSTTLKPQKLP
ncbi:activating transcription factor 7-interacting protein 2 [Bufo bufo]|uniref:activating transcription factor 7-interacting protein 2 n=1 Tax=Bufo bufo TaxID=8384 RepID=UPI001ABDD351|nr:activating transcription factor 7-interacting protein 2 [Bufo bufo]